MPVSLASIISLKNQCQHWAQRLMLIILVRWEVEAGGSLEPKHLRPAWETQQDLVSQKKKKNYREKSVPARRGGSRL